MGNFPSLPHSAQAEAERGLRRETRRLRDLPLQPLGGPCVPVSSARGCDHSRVQWHQPSSREPRRRAPARPAAPAAPLLQLAGSRFLPLCLAHSLSLALLSEHNESLCVAVTPGSGASVSNAANRRERERKIQATSFFFLFFFSIYKAEQIQEIEPHCLLRVQTLSPTGPDGMYKSGQESGWT